MNAERLLALYEKVADAPDAVPRLRRFVLDLAVRGKLVPQDAGDEPASELLKRIAAEKARLVKAGEIRKQKPVAKIGADELPFDLPVGWAWARLGSLIDLLSGQHLQPPEYSESLGSGVPYITGPSDFGTGGLVIRRYALVRKAVAKRGQLLLTVKGSGVGKATICDLDEVAISRQLMALTAISWEPAFLELVADRLATKLQGEARSLIPGISREDVTGFVVALPPHAEQQRIVAKVEELMALLDRLEAARTAREATRDRLTAASLARLTAPDTDEAEFPSNARFALATLPALTTRPDQIKSLRQTILNLAVRGKLVDQDPNDETALVGKHKLQNEPPFDAPSGWKWVPFSAVAAFENGDRSKKYPKRAEYVASGVPWINTGHIESDGTLSRSTMHFITEEKFASLSGGKIRPGDLVYCLRGATFGKTAFVEPYEQGAIASSLMIIRLGGQIDRRYAFIYLTSPLGREQLRRFDNGTAQPNLSSASVKRYQVPLPPLAEQHRIVAKVDALMTLCDRLEAALTTADTTRARLLDALLADALNPASMQEMEAAE